MHALTFIEFSSPEKNKYIERGGYRWDDNDWRLGFPSRGRGYWEGLVARKLQIIHATYHIPMIIMFLPESAVALARDTFGGYRSLSGRAAPKFRRADIFLLHRA